MAKAEASVEELVSMIQRGEPRLPEMQRRYVPPLVAQHGAQLFKAQAIPLESGLLAVPNYKAFLIQRRKLIAYRLNEFLGLKARSVATPDTLTVAVSAA